MSQPKDYQAREQALDISSSFLVQAPAGSGKTELLTQRVLALLAHANLPEDVLAITFTRKAAAEMTARIHKALMHAQQEDKPESPHQAKTHQLANAVLQRSQELQWDLVDNPTRLKVQTIDAFCASLIKQLPITSDLGYGIQITDDAPSLYQRAAHELVKEIESPNSPTHADLTTLLLHLDNQPQRLESLLTNMLSRREQWLPYLYQVKQTNEAREALERTLAHTIDDILDKAHGLLSLEQRDVLHQLLITAMMYHSESEVDTNILAYGDQTQFPEPSHENKAAFGAVVHLLLTQQDTYRARLTKNLGFPAPSGTKDKEEKAKRTLHKEKVGQLIETLKENPLVLEALTDVKNAPAPTYSDSQWEVLTALLRVLPKLVAYLLVVFRQQGALDFSELTTRTQFALGSSENIDVLLALDYRIKHILIDEFQDTSISHYHLLEHLIQDWQEGDGRTLFLVGDPMQSIYRFRQAEVGLFLKVAESGIGTIQPTPLQLTVNFRSTAPLIEWFNQTFGQAFPSLPDIRFGAIPYATADSMAGSSDAFPAYAISIESDEGEKICSLIQAIREQAPNESIAVLVKARYQLDEIIQCFKQQNIPFHAVAIESLGEKPHLQDLWVLTRAMLQPADRLAWFSLLRSPFCGLSLADLLVIESHSQEQTIPEALASSVCLAELSPDGKHRATRLTHQLQPAIDKAYRIHLTELVESAWQSIGGPSTLNHAHWQDEVSAYFKLLEQHSRGGDLLDFSKVEQALLALYADNQSDDETAVNLMTIHKSKGLEFDHVILPGLSDTAFKSEQPLLLWSERTDMSASGDFSLLMAPLKEQNTESDQTYQYLLLQEKRKNAFEQLRLLYVAATRAKKTLYLCFDYDDEEEGYLLPENSLGNFILDSVSELDEFTLDCPLEVASATGRLKRLPADSTLPDIAKAFTHDTAQNPRPANGYLLSDPFFTILGTYLHRLMYHIGCEGLDKWQSSPLDNNRHRVGLLRMGLNEDKLPLAIETIERSLTQVLTDERAKWLFSGAHQNVHNEFTIITESEMGVKTHRLDRTFVSDDIRYIIDYKTSPEPAEDFDGFLAQQKALYHSQLLNYAQYFQDREAYPIVGALYYPQFAGWIQWSLNP